MGNGERKVMKDTKTSITKGKREKKINNKTVFEVSNKCMICGHERIWCMEMDVKLLEFSKNCN